MKRLLLGAGTLALVLPLATATPGVAQEEECSCTIGDAPFVTMRGPGSFGFFSSSQARIGIGFSSEEQDDVLDVGARITEVVEDSPAEEAGLQEGDVILSVDGHSLMDPLSRRQERTIDEDGSAPVQRLMVLARSWEPDEVVTLEVLRDGDERTINVTPEERRFDMEPFRLRMGELGDRLEHLGPQIEHRMEGLAERLEEGALHRDAPRLRVWSSDGNDFAFGFGLLGLQMTALNPQLGNYFGVDEGVLVTEVSEESTLGLVPGDVIVTIDGRSVDSPRDVRRILGSYDEDEEIQFGIYREGSERTVSGTVR